MHVWKARVKNGRLRPDEPTDLPEGTEVELQLVDSEEMSAEERERLFASLRRGLADAKAGRVTDMDEFLDELESQP